MAPVSIMDGILRARRGEWWHRGCTEMTHSYCSHYSSIESISYITYSISYIFLIPSPAHKSTLHHASLYSIHTFTNAQRHGLPYTHSANSDHPHNHTPVAHTLQATTE